MRRLIMLALILLVASSAAAGDVRQHWYQQHPDLKYTQHRMYFGINGNDVGVGPSFAYEIGWGDRWAIQLGAGSVAYEKARCVNAWFCEALHGSRVQGFGWSPLPQPQPTGPLVTLTDESKPTFTLMLQVLKRQRLK